MTRKLELIEADIYYVEQALIQADAFDQKFGQLVNKRNNLLLEKRVAENPVYLQKERVHFLVIQSKMNG